MFNLLKAEQVGVENTIYRLGVALEVWAAQKNWSALREVNFWAADLAQRSATLSGMMAIKYQPTEEKP